ncbi:hypothetical protein PFICI_10791 [Pestalotiopsis fici W106-1]|uniref:ABC transporter domain-containing protein n=1 Tax=Pestalotiopsis fici (strain W106-1 / CGMCC3.15140) TaxID=1229662 RepID=W3WUV6_PESFW|nr:uncharacterized protein PFICI_10791 [Pestalotiopsis fici W106-1]ETS76917.1 hypothetical protein PFICI_10791 [Pestalotiopsis fici W106-1]
MESDPGATGVSSHNENKTPSSRSGASSGAGSLTIFDGNEHSVDEHHAQMSVEIMELARRFTNQSQNQGSDLFPMVIGSKLDPNSEQFDARSWAKAFYNVRVRASEGKALRTTGVAFKNLSTFGFGSATDFQKSVGNVYIEAYGMIHDLIHPRKRRIDILQDLEGVLHSGEMLAVLGPPGSGCSTFLRAISGETHGFHVSKDSVLNYEGVRPDQMQTAFRGESIYTAEVDDHFAHLTVGDTLYFAARARCPETLPDGVSRHEFATHMRDVTMALFGISHTLNTRVGNDFVRGVSGGERKRVTIAEAALSFAPLQCWDNSTRGLDSANAVEFCKTLRTQADVIGCSSCVAIYQAPQSAYDLFDKVMVLYEGRQIYFGKARDAANYFEELGFERPAQQTTADFLTSMTNSTERVIRAGWEDKTPRTPDDFAKAWKSSSARAQLIQEVDSYISNHPFDGDHFQNFLDARRLDQSQHQRPLSPYLISYWEQFTLTLWRSWTLFRTDPSVTLTMLVSNIFEALITASIFYNLPADTSSFFKRTLLLFMVILLNAFGSILEIMTLYEKRRIVEKHSRYAFYHPSAEALSAMIADLPYKIINAILLNTTLYFMTNLRREAGAFFFFLLFSFTITLTMSMMFRLIGSVTKSVAQALAPASIILLAIALYTGFAVPPTYMKSWLGWIRWINPVYYGLESVFVNEFVGRSFSCAHFVPSGPGYADLGPENRVCQTVGASPSENFVDGTAYLLSSYGYKSAHRWRNFGILVAFMIAFMALHLLATEYIASERSQGEILVFLRRTLKRAQLQDTDDVETQAASPLPREYESQPSDTEKIEQQTSVFHWSKICYDVKIKNQDRRILDNVDGWVKPGTLTALMGVSGAGKTTLLDVLADRVTMGIVSGDMRVNDKIRDASFQRKTGYVQQQDIHLHTSTVREALNFSAILRQPSQYTHDEKLAYVDTVISLLGMEEYSDAIVGTPGEGLNVEQRKRLTIGVELAARPQLLLFLDEPTSGLDSQTSWSICNLMEKLRDNGQAILCTIHQPSAMLFQRFDRLLLLAKGGKTVYFGEIGKSSHVLLDYFQRHGADPCLEETNPAEYMLQVIGAAPGAVTDIDWPAVWRGSTECEAVQMELSRLSSNVTQTITATGNETQVEFAAPFRTQLYQTAKRVFQQYWRSPGYIYSKTALSVGAALFIGLTFMNAENTQRGLQNQMFGVFVFLTIFGQVLEQILPVFVSQRTLYEARERPSKAYSWKAFLLSNIFVEMAYNTLMAVLCFVCWYFPIGLYRNAYFTNTVDSRGITAFLHVWAFFMFTSTFANMIIAGLESADVAGAIANLFFIMMFLFCGILAGPDTLPRFWIFMYRVNPFTYVVEGFMGNALGNSEVQCAANEVLTFHAPNSTTCAEYLANYLDNAGGYLISGTSEQSCQYCPIQSTNSFLASLNVDFANRWRDFGFVLAYCVFNIVAAIGFYWLARVPKGKKVKTV